MHTNRNLFLISSKDAKNTEIFYCKPEGLDSFHIEITNPRAFINWYEHIFGKSEKRLSLEKRLKLKKGLF